MQKLSALIREGAKKRAQAFGDFVCTNWPVKNGIPTPENCTCALGAAYEALTGELPDPNLSLSEMTNFLANSTGSMWSEIPYPREATTITGVDQTIDVVISLNDYYKWSRERIADYLEQQGQ